MSIQNINFLQSDNDTAYIPNIGNYTTASVYQALANSGQRYGAKGDSIAIAYFTLDEINGVIHKDSNSESIDSSTIDLAIIQKTSSIDVSDSFNENGSGNVSIKDTGKISDYELPPTVDIPTIDNILINIESKDASSEYYYYIIYDDTNDRLICRAKSTNYVISNVKDSSSEYESSDLTNNEIFKKIIAELKKTISDNEYGIVIPNNYKFYYYYNSNDDHEVYSSAEGITVNYVSSEKEIIADTVNVVDNTQVNHSSIYKFNITYTDTSTVINVSQVYSLPYINKDHYWVVNNIETGIYASGDYTGQPSIIMVRTSNTNDSHEIIHMPTLVDDDEKSVEDRITWISTSCDVNLVLSSSVKTHNNVKTIEPITYTAYTYIPYIKEINTNNDLQSLYQNSLLVNIIDCTYIDSNNKKKYTVSTLWQYDNVNNVFKPIINSDDNTILTVSDISSSYEYLQSFIENFELVITPDEYKYRSISFPHINSEPKNTINTEDNKSFLLAAIRSSYNYNELTNNAVLKLYYNTNVLSESYGYMPDITSDRNQILNFDLQDTLQSVCLSSSVVTDESGNQHDYKEDNTHTTRNFVYTFNSNVPTLDLSEVITDGVIIKDTQSFITLSKDNIAYTASLGFDYYSNNKNTLYLSSSPYIPKIGTLDLAVSYHGKYLVGPENFKVKFNNTIFDSNIWKQITSNIYTTTYNPIYVNYVGGDPQTSGCNVTINTIDFTKPDDGITISDKTLDSAVSNGTLLMIYNLYNGTEYLGETRYLNVNNVLKNLGVDIGKYTSGGDKKIKNYWLELSQLGVGSNFDTAIYDTKTTDEQTTYSWVGNPINVSFSMKDNNIYKVIFEEQCSTHWNSNSVVKLHQTFDEDDVIQHNFLTDIGKQVIINVANIELSTPDIIDGGSMTPAVNNTDTENSSAQIIEQ